MFLPAATSASKHNKRTVQRILSPLPLPIGLWGLADADPIGSAGEPRSPSQRFGIPVDHSAQATSTGWNSSRTGRLRSAPRPNTSRLLTYWATAREHGDEERGDQRTHQNPVAAQQRQPGAEPPPEAITTWSSSIGTDLSTWRGTSRDPRTGGLGPGPGLSWPQLVGGS